MCFMVSIEFGFGILEVRESIKNWNRRYAEDMSITTEERMEILTPLRTEQANYEY